MKKILSLLLFICIAQVFAHNSNELQHLSRHWTIKGSDKNIEGTFLMQKDQRVYIEKKDHSILPIEFVSLSEADQKFVEHKQAMIYQINHPVNKNKISNSPIFNVKDCILLLMAIALTLTLIVVYRKGTKEKLKYVLPVMTTGIILSLYGFTNKVMKTMATTTDPLFVDSAFAPFKPKVYTRWDNTYFYVESKGIPSHPMMAGITGWQQQFPIPQCYTGTNAWSIPLNPVVASTPVPVNQNHFLRGAIAIATNGVAIFNPYTNTGVDALLDGQLDNYGGHCGRADDYHYHIAPLFLDDQTSDILPIAFALDGYAVYGSKEPDGSAMKTLDQNHGHLGTNGIYHYHGTATAPYMVGNMVGKVTEDSTLQIIPQASAKPIRPSGTPLKGAVITSCKPNATGNGYTLIYTLSGSTDSVEYSWTNAGVYTFNFYKSGVKTTNVYNGFKPCNLPLSIYAIDHANFDISLYPNPARSSINIRLSNNINANDIGLISIYDMTGKLMYQSNKFKDTIDIKTFATGLYVVKIKVAELSISKKILVQ